VLFEEEKEALLLLAILVVAAAAVVVVVIGTFCYYVQKLPHLKLWQLNELFLSYFLYNFVSCRQPTAKLPAG
jgi:hypothetical protein